MAAKRCCLLPLFVLQAFSPVAQLQPGPSPTDVFTVYYPCPIENVNISVARECDVFVYSAVQLALERTKQDNDTTVGLLPLSLETGNKFDERSTEILFNLYIDLATASGEFEDAISVLRGGLGPDEDYVLGRTVVGLSRSEDIPHVAYGLTDSRVNDLFSDYFHTVPSTLALATARVALIVNFGWIRFGIMSSSDPGYRYQGEVFSQIYRTSLLYGLPDSAAVILAVADSTGFGSDLNHSLRQLHRNNINIIMGFFTAAEARTILCEASSSSYNLTSPNHVWILPAYYGPDWWRIERENSFSKQKTKNCTEQEMRDILQSTIFIDPVKFSPMATSLGEFYDDLLNKTVELYPELDSYEELWPLLLNSRAVSAYDATLLLVNSLVNHTVDTELIRGSMLCEICRIYPVGVPSNESTTVCNNISTACHNSSLRAAKGEYDDKDHRISNLFGQFILYQLISKFKIVSRPCTN